MGEMPGKPWQVYLIAADGGTPEHLVPSARNQGDPGWSPDGRQLVYGGQALPEDQARENAIRILDLGTHHQTVLPGSEGMWSPRWSPDGRYLAAMTNNTQQLNLYEFATASGQRWRKPLLLIPNGRGKAITFTSWVRFRAREPYTDSGSLTADSKP